MQCLERTDLERVRDYPAFGRPTVKLYPRRLIPNAEPFLGIQKQSELMRDTGTDRADRRGETSRHFPVDMAADDPLDLRMPDDDLRRSFASGNSSRQWRGRF